MRHRVAGRRLSRTSEHRLALRRNLAASLFEHETISTTVEKAKYVRPFAEKLITLAKKGTLSARRRAIALLGNRDIIGNEDGAPAKQGTIIGKLFSDIGPRYLDRAGGYTRIIRLSLGRLGDNSALVLLQLIGKDEAVQKKAKTTAQEVAGKKAEAKEPSEAEDITEAEEVIEAEELKESEPATETKELNEPEEPSDSEKASGDKKQEQAQETSDEEKQADKS